MRIVYDGRYANVGWMQEIPRPVTNLSWDNAALMSFATMEKNGLAENDAVEISVGGKKIIAGALAVPGQADDVVVVTLGQGRQVGRVAGGVGYNAYLIQQSGAPWMQSGATLRKTGDIYDICVTKSHHIDQRSPESRRRRIGHAFDRRQRVAGSRDHPLRDAD